MEEAVTQGSPTPANPPAELLKLPAEIRRAGELALDKKATDVMALDLRGLSSATDYFLLATGSSDTQVRAIAEYIVDELKKEGVRPAFVEGMKGGSTWVLIDYVDFVVHVFHPTARGFYQLETLWGDAPAAVFEG
jgi:ribosome-associated protein